MQMIVQYTPEKAQQLNGVVVWHLSTPVIQTVKFVSEVIGRVYA